MSVFSLNTTSLSEYDISNIVPDETYANEFGMFQLQMDALKEDAEIFDMMIGRDFAEASTMVNEESVITESQVIALTEAAGKKLKEKILEALRKFASGFLAAMDSLLKKIEEKVDYWGKVAKMYGTKAINNSKESKTQVKYVVLDKKIEPSCNAIVMKYANIVQYYKYDAKKIVEMKDDVTPEVVANDIVGTNMDGITKEKLHDYMFNTKETGANTADTKIAVQELSSAKAELAKFRKFKDDVLKAIKKIETNAKDIKDAAQINIKYDTDHNERTKNHVVSEAAAGDLILHNINCIRSAVAKVCGVWSSAYVKGMNEMAGVVMRLARSSSSREEGKKSKETATEESAKFFDESVCNEDEFRTSSSTGDEKVAEPKNPPMDTSEPEEDIATESTEEEETVEEMSIEDLMKMVREINESLELEEEE